MSEDPTRATPRPVERELPTHGSVGPADPRDDPATKPALRPAKPSDLDGPPTDPGLRPVPPGAGGDGPTVALPGPTEPVRLPPAVTRTRTGGLWTGLILSAVVLLFLLIFILQNLGTVQIYFLGFAGTLPVGVAMLLAAVAGLLLVAIPGGLRILQLRRAARRGASR
jgi:uncharacterized integral membrane protein